MSVRVVKPGETITKRPAEVLVLRFDWTDWLQELSAAAVIATSTFTLESPDGALVKDNPGLVTGNLIAKVRVSAGTLDTTYRLICSVVTDETPTQTGERWIDIRVQA